ncbi:MAG: aldehyde dehydrogenase family protein, partial [Candidatus Marinimicrobia bacterium]|nr:aldehyde dehydrogenase family protein [Candidatus Neomarinimicrobiota bacterium]
MNIDNDLISIQEVRTLIPLAGKAQDEFRRFSPNRIDDICKKIADVAYKESTTLSKMAVEETGMGNYEDKITKNQFASRDLWNAIKDMKILGILSEDKRKKIVEIGEAKGIIAAIIPTTNPTSTSIYKIIISLKAGNAIIGSPHPLAAACTWTTFEILRKAAEQAGAPEGLISCMKTPSIEGATELIKDHRIAVILATGGPGIVKAAYSSGTPALGVGAGNTPVYVEQSARLEKAAKDIVTGKSFDNGLICSSEQTLICDKKIYDPLKKLLIENRAYMVTKEETVKLENTMFVSGHLNTKIV